MDERFERIAAVAAQQHSVVSSRQLRLAGIDSSLAAKYARHRVLDRIGPRSFAIGGSAPTWRRALMGAFLDLDGVGIVAGRSGARLHGLDGFADDDVELLVPRKYRNRVTRGVVRSTAQPVPVTDLVRIDGFTVVRAERLILDSGLFQFTTREIENAIDSSIRLRLVGEQRLRTRAVAQHRSGINGSRRVLDALIDGGGESRLERLFLRICREAGLPRPMLQQTYRADGRTIARVDAEFPGGLVVEVAGHGTHASRRQRQRDAERHTELTVRGKRVLTFTYEDVRDRPNWVLSRVRAGLRLAS